MSRRGISVTRTGYDVESWQLRADLGLIDIFFHTCNNILITKFWKILHCSLKKLELCVFV